MSRENEINTRLKVVHDVIDNIGHPAHKLTLGDTDTDDGFVSASNPLPVALPGSANSVFGQVLTSELTPVLQAYLERANDSRYWRTFSASGGSISISDALATLSVDTTSGAYYSLQTKGQVEYEPGQGVTARFTASFDANAVANSTQLVGPYHAEDGLAFGYDGTEFGVLHRYGRKLEIQALTVTGAAGGSENATITIDGQGHTVPLTAGTVQQNAYEIAEFGSGYAGSDSVAWVTFQLDDVVYFLRQSSGDATGSMTFSSATATGTFAETQAGADGTNSWTPQASWNIDAMDGTGPSGMTLDAAKINVYEVRFGWLGVAGLEYCVFDEASHKFWPVHFIQWANTASATRTSLSDPRLPIGYSVASLGSTTALSISGASCMAGSHGKPALLGEQFSESSITTNVGTTELPLLAIQCAPVDPALSKINRRQLLITGISLANVTGKDATVKVYRCESSNLDNYNWQTRDNHFAYWYDNAADGVTGLGGAIRSAVLDGNTNAEIRFETPIKLQRTEVLLVTGQTDTASTTFDVAINGQEDL